MNSSKTGKPQSAEPTQQESLDSLKEIISGLLQKMRDGEPMPHAIQDYILSEAALLHLI